MNPFNFSATRALSALDLTHNLVASYQYQAPARALLRAREGADQRMGAFRNHARQHRISGDAASATAITRLMGSIPNGVNNHSLDLPDYNGAPLQL